jgi:hypothetical protein
MKKKILVFRQDEGSVRTAQTEGMLRKELVATPNAWVWSVRNQDSFRDGTTTAITKPSSTLFLVKSKWNSGRRARKAASENQV